MSLSNELLNEPIADFLRRVADEHNLETKFVLANAINAFKKFSKPWKQPITVSCVLKANDWGGWMTERRGRLLFSKNYGWKTHDFVK